MIFETRIAGIPCQCEVVSFSPDRPMHVYGPGMGDAHAPEPAEMEYVILDRKGYRAKWLEAKITPQIDSDICEEFQAAMTAERHGIDY